MSATESLRQRRQSSRGASILSCTTMVIHDHEHELDDHHMSTRISSTRECVGSLPQGHPGLCGTQVGLGRTPLVHRCPEGKAVGGPTKVSSDLTKDTDDTKVTAPRCLSPGIQTW